MATRTRRLFEAIEAGRYSEVVALLDAEPSLLEVLGTHNARVRDKTPLMYAIQSRSYRCARELVQRGADVRARMPAGPRSSVLQLAVGLVGPRNDDDFARRLALVTELMDRGADPTEALWTNSAHELVRINAARLAPAVLRLFES